VSNEVEVVDQLTLGRLRVWEQRLVKIRQPYLIAHLIGVAHVVRPAVRPRTTLGCVVPPAHRRLTGDTAPWSWLSPTRSSREAPHGPGFLPEFRGRSAPCRSTRWPDGPSPHADRYHCGGAPRMSRRHRCPSTSLGRPVPRPSTPQVAHCVAGESR